MWDETSQYNLVSNIWAMAREKVIVCYMAQIKLSIHATVCF